MRCTWAKSVQEDHAGAVNVRRARVQPTHTAAARWRRSGVDELHPREKVSNADGYSVDESTS